MAYRQFAARDYFVEVDHPSTGPKRYAGWPYRMGSSKPRVSRPGAVPGRALGADPSELNGNHAGARTTVAPSGSESATATDRTALPLEGIRVAEFAWVWAGPYAGVLLSALGAEVIKVEGPKRLDLPAAPSSGRAPRSATEDRSDAGMAFNTMNLNKQSLTLDLSQREGRELALPPRRRVRRGLRQHAPRGDGQARPGLREPCTARTPG